jgi:dUTP pyrophosphatase
MTSKNIILKIKQFNDAPLLSFGDWIDLAASKDMPYTKGELILIPLGLAMQLPEGYEAHILPRSSTFKNFGLLHASSGLIDNNYCGDNDEWFFCAYATRDGKVSKGDRVCQFRLVEIMPKIICEYVDSLNNPDRGGFGSTGK